MMVVSKSSPIPAASLPIRLAVAGARMMASTSCPRETCSKGATAPGPNMAAATGSPVSAWKVRGATNSRAAAVIATLTWAPAMIRRRASSAAL